MTPSADSGVGVGVLWKMTLPRESIRFDDAVRVR
jgi:hypothetical protein